MQELYNKIKHYTFEDCLGIEEDDRQFIALQKLNDCLSTQVLNKYLFCVILNSIICYQLSGKGEDYWEEFSDYFCDKDLNNIDLINELKLFIKQSKNNKRFVDTKIKRLEKLRNFAEIFEGKEEYYYKNMIKLRDNLSKELKQDPSSKTIVFAVKMFGYGARNIYKFEKYPFGISIPVDSRLTALFEKYKRDYTDINKFYSDLSKEMNIPPLHLDGIVWNLYDNLMTDE